VLFFFGSTGFTMVNLFASAWNQPDVEATQSPEDPLKQQEQGYELVLQREPDNVAALEGLVNTRLQMNDQAGAIEPLERLVKLRPHQTDYTTLLGQLQQAKQ
jgi:predicted Zn-dependent protease